MSLSLLAICCLPGVVVLWPASVLFFRGIRWAEAKRSKPLPRFTVTLFTVLPAILFVSAPALDVIPLPSIILFSSFEEDIYLRDAIMAISWPSIVTGTPGYLWACADWQISRLPAATSKSELDNRPTRGHYIVIGIAINIGLVFAACSVVLYSWS